MRKEMQAYLALQDIGLNACEEYSLEKEGFHFVLPKSGSGRYLSASQVLSLGAEELLVAKGSAGGKVRAERTELHFQAFSLSLEQLFPLFAIQEIALLQRVMESFNTPRIWPAATAVATECRRLAAEAPRQNNLEHRCHLLKIAGNILESEFGRAQRQQMGSEGAAEHMAGVFDKLTTEEMLNLSAGAMAAKFGCSRRHLNRLFHRFLGHSITALRTEMRLLRAISLLRNPGLKVISVAGQCGFNHLGLFNNCFRRRFGLSPGEWRKQALLGEGHYCGTTRDNTLGLLQAKGLFAAAEAPETRAATPRAALSPETVPPIAVTSRIASDSALTNSAA